MESGTIPEKEKQVLMLDICRRCRYDTSCLDCVDVIWRVDTRVFWMRLCWAKFPKIELSGLMELGFSRNAMVGWENVGTNWDL